MDPFAIIGGVVTIAGIVSSTVNELREIFSAVKEIQDLKEEVGKIRDTFQEAQNVFDERKQHVNLPQQKVEEGLKIVCEAQKKLLELHDLLKKCLRSSGKKLGGDKLVYFTWVRSRKEIKDIQQTLMSARLVLCAFWGVCPDVSRATKL